MNTDATLLASSTFLRMKIDELNTIITSKKSYLFRRRKRIIDSAQRTEIVSFPRVMPCVAFPQQNKLFCGYSFLLIKIYAHNDHFSWRKYDVYLTKSFVILAKASQYFKHGIISGHNFFPVLKLVCDYVCGLLDQL